MVSSWGSHCTDGSSRSVSDFRLVTAICKIGYTNTKLRAISMIYSAMRATSCTHQRLVRNLPSGSRRLTFFAILSSPLSGHVGDALRVQALQSHLIGRLQHRNLGGPALLCDEHQQSQGDA